MCRRGLCRRLFEPGRTGLHRLSLYNCLQVGERSLALLDHMQQLLQALARAPALLLAQRRRLVELVLVEYLYMSSRINPDVEQQVDLLDALLDKDSRLRNIAVPALTHTIGRR